MHAETILLMMRTFDELLAMPDAELLKAFEEHVPGDIAEFLTDMNAFEEAEEGRCFQMV